MNPMSGVTTGVTKKTSSNVQQGKLFGRAIGLNLGPSLAEIASSIKGVFHKFSSNKSSSNKVSGNQFSSNTATAPAKISGSKNSGVVGFVSAMESSDVNMTEAESLKQRPEAKKYVQGSNSLGVSLGSSYGSPAHIANQAFGGVIASEKPQVIGQFYVMALHKSLSDVETAVKKEVGKNKSPFEQMSPLLQVLAEFESSVNQLPAPAQYEARKALHNEHVLSHPFLAPFAAGKQREFMGMFASYPSFADMVLKAGPKLINEASEKGVAKLSRKNTSLPYSLVAIRSEDGKTVSLQATGQVLGEGTYKIAKGCFQVTSPVTPEQKIVEIQTPIAKISIRKQQLQTLGDAEKQALQDEVKHEALIAQQLLGAGAKNVLATRLINYNNKVHLFSKECRGGNVESYMISRSRRGQPIKKEEALRIAYEQVKVLQVMHDSCGLCHLDLKLPNIMLEGNPEKPDSLVSRLSDFGTTKAIDHSQGIGCVSTFPPPEMAADGSHFPGIAPSLDMWSYGIILYSLYHPGASARNLAFDMQGSEKYHECLNGIRTKCNGSKDPVDHLIVKLLSDNPGERPTAAQVVAFFEGS